MANGEPTKQRANSIQNNMSRGGNYTMQEQPNMAKISWRGTLTVCRCGATLVRCNLPRRASTVTAVSISNSLFTMKDDII